MDIKIGNGKTKYGPGVNIHLTGYEIERAINAYLVSRGITIVGPRTITVNEELCDFGLVCVAPSGSVEDQNNKLTFMGNGEVEDTSS